MMNEQLIQKAKTAKTAEELMEMAKEAGYPLTEEQAAQAFEKLHTQVGEISDLELNGVSGGGCGGGGTRVTGLRMGETCPRCGNDCWVYSVDAQMTAASQVYSVFSCAVCEAKHTSFSTYIPPSITTYDLTLKNQPHNTEAWT